MHMVLSELSSSVRSFARSIKVVRAAALRGPCPVSVESKTLLLGFGLALPCDTSEDVVQVLVGLQLPCPGDEQEFVHSIDSDVTCQDCSLIVSSL